MDHLSVGLPGPSTRVTRGRPSYSSSEVVST
jgi:hypothetical protein